MQFKNLNKKTRIILILQCFGMLMGASTHIQWVIHNGIFTYQPEIPILSTYFWDCLTFLDITAALLLILKPMWGVVLTMVIIIADILHNCHYLFFVNNHIIYSGITDWSVQNWMLIMQIAFMVFVLSTFKSTFKEIKRKTSYEISKN